MTTRLWGSSQDPRSAGRFDAFMAGEDLHLDRQLVEYDIRASLAHAEGLAQIGILSAGELAAITGCLGELRHEIGSGSCKLVGFEDGHSAIEAFAVKRLGELGKKIHTGRSRNDQVVVATRLFMRDALDHLGRNLVDLSRVCLARAHREMLDPMPGYTHLQRAVVSSVGFWFASWAECFVDDLQLVVSARRLINANPLGTAAGYGVNLSLAREEVSRSLDFDRVQLNPLSVQTSRGKYELVLLEAYSHCLLDLRRLAWDLSLFATQEFAFVELPPDALTGSSIMPNKKNPDLVELLRAQVASLLGAREEIESLLSLPSGYHRDLQATKGPLLRGVAAGKRALCVAVPLLQDLRFRSERLEAAIDPEMFATDRAVDLAAGGLAFRDAYRQVAAELERAAPRAKDPRESLRARTSLGAPGNPGLGRLRRRLAELAVHFPV